MAPKKDSKGDKKSKNSGYFTDGRPGSSNDPMFQPTITATSDEDLEKLSKEFGNMTLSEQLIIAKSFEDAVENLANQKAHIKSVKQVKLMIANEEKKSNKKKGSKKESERFLKSKVTVKVIVGDVTYEIEMYLSDRLGTLRAYLAVKMGLKRDAKFKFMKDGVVFKNKKNEEASMATFFYTLNFTDGITISALVIKDEETTVTSTAQDAMPIGDAVATGGGPSDNDGQFVNETLEMMGLVDGDEDDTEGEVSEYEGINEQ